MKQYLLFFLLFFISSPLFSQNVGINTDGSTPDSSAMLDIKSTSKGLLIPRMTTSQRTNISNAVDGLLVFDESSQSFWFHSGSSWVELVSGGIDEMADADGDTKIQVEEGADDNVIRFDINGTQMLSFQDNGHGELMINGKTFYDNTFLGYNAGANTEPFVIGNVGSYNTFLGSNAGRKNDTGYRNSIIGAYSGNKITDGNSNIFLGYSTSSDLQTGDDNTVAGAYAFDEATSGEENVIIGMDAGGNKTGGNQNTLLGGKTGYNSGSGSGHVFVGYGAGYSATGDNKLFIENSTSNSPLIYGEFDNKKLACNGDFYVNESSTSNTTMQLFFTAADSPKFSMGYNSNSDFFVIKDEVNNDQVFYIKDGKIGIQRSSPSNAFEVNGTASKSIPGDWLGNSDARLKKNIQVIPSENILQQLLQLRGITYEWDDQREEFPRPEGIQYGFTAQNIQEVFPHLVSEDNEGYLQTAYGTYDAMYVEAIRALVEKVERLEQKVNRLEANTSLAHMAFRPYAFGACLVFFFLLWFRENN